MFPCVQGCEGRSNNEVSVFFDMLTHPGADFGSEGPPLVDWRRRKDLEVDHVVLGKGRPGGCWEVSEQGCQMAKFDPFLSLDCARVEGVGAQSKERKGSNFAA